MQLLGDTIMKNDSAGKWRKDMLPHWAIIWGVESRYGRRGKIRGLQGSAALILAPS